MKEIFLSILKLFAFLLLAPLIVAILIAFQNQILVLPANKEVWILWGAGIYVALNLFVYDFKNIYDFGKSLVEKSFPFFKPAGLILPVFSLLIIIFYIIALIMGRGTTFQAYFLFAIAFTMAMQLVLSAHEIYDSDKSILKAHYLITFGIVLVFSLLLMSLLLAWAIPEYSFIGFIKTLSTHTINFYHTIYKALFVDPT